MNAALAILGIARADFLERVRRFSFLVTLFSGAFLGYLAATGRVLVLLDDYRGVYTAGWIGTMVALVTTAFVSLIGFYVVKNSVDRDRSTRVGQILAATPLSKPAYLIGKFLSNFGVLSAVTGVLATGAVVMYFLAGEAPPFGLWPILSPFLLLVLPVMALTAALAVVFECVPFLRGGFGNIAWFFGWSMTMALPAITKKQWLDPIGVVTVLERFRPAAVKNIPNYHGGMQLTIRGGVTPKIAEHLLWQGFPWTTEDVLLRLMWVLTALALVLLASLVFDRFDSARELLPGPRRNGGRAAMATPAASRSGSAVHLTPLPKAARSGSQFFTMVAGELRLSMKGCRWWWYAVAAGLLVAQFVTPLGAARGPLLAVAWLWPALLWSAMGSRESRFSVRQLLFSSARIVPRQLPACWTAGLLLALITGAGALLRLGATGNWVGVGGALAGAVFIPSLALFLGVLSGSGKFFEGLYTALWYIGPLNGTPGLDYTGAANGSRTLPVGGLYAALAIGLVVLAFVVRARQLHHD